MAETIRADAKALYNIAYKTFLSQGLPDDEAALAADVLNLADRRGVSSHGLNRVYLYLYPIMNGACPKACQLEVLKESPGTLMIDAHHSLGIVAAPKAMRMTIERARKNGVCVTAVRNSGHLGMVGYYSHMAAQERMVGLAISGTPQLMVPWGGKRPTLSNSPWSLSFPGGSHYPHPIMLDMATSEVAGGKVELAAREGKKIPLNWGLDKNGVPTDDPDVLWKSMGYLPFGGVKGYCLGVLWDMLSSVLPGGGFDGGVMKDLQSPSNFGHFFMALDPGFFRDWGEIEADVDRFTRMVKSTPLAEGAEEILLPGEPEMRNCQKSAEQGVELSLKLAEELTEILKKANILPDSAGIDKLLTM